MKTKYLCKNCQKAELERPKLKYCEECREAFKRYGCWRYKISKDVYVWSKTPIKRAVVKGKNVVPIREVFEVVD